MLKVEKETGNEMVLKEGKIAHILIGLVFAAAGAVMLLMPDLFEGGAPPWWAGALFVVIGLAVALFVQGSTLVEIDKAANRLNIARAGLITKSRKDYELDKVEEVELRRYYSTTGSGRSRSTKMNVELSAVFKGGSKAILMTSSSSGVMTAFAGGGEKGNMAQRIANFIGVPFKDRRPPTVQETVEAISKGIAKGMQKKD